MSTPPVQRAYAGSRTTRERNARGEGITRFRLEEGGALVREAIHGGLPNPSYLAFNTTGDRLYAVHGDGQEVSVFAVDAASGALTELQRRHCGGRNPVHLALDAPGRHLLVSDHLGEGRSGGALLLLPVLADGTLGAVCQRIPMVGELGPHRVEQSCARPHFNPFSPDGRFALVPDKGLDAVFVFPYDAARGRLAPTPCCTLPSREGAGPRHLAFAPGGRHAYVVNELDSTVTACSFDAASGQLAAFQVLSTLADDRTAAPNRAAGIQLSACGSLLFASNRGSDTIAVFGVAPGSGRLHWVAAVACGGRTPRFFTPSPDGRLLYVLNEDSDSIVRLALPPAGTPGAPTRLAGEVACGSPTCLVFAPPQARA